MLRLPADEHFNGSIIRGLLRRKPEMDVVRVQDVGLSGADDRLVLAWAAHAGRVLLTHDQKTVPTHTYERVMAGLVIPGVFMGDTYVLVQQAIEDIVLLVECNEEHEWEGRCAICHDQEKRSTASSFLLRCMSRECPLPVRMNVEYQ